MNQKFNITAQSEIDSNYSSGLLPQRNNKNLFYQETSCRANLSKFNLSSENRRIIRKTENYTFEKIPIRQFDYTPKVQKNIKNWIRNLNWDFPISSVKNVFNNHIFNYLFIWKDQNKDIIAYAVCYYSDSISHIAYVFFDPKISHQDLPIRIVLEFIKNSHQLNLLYAYLGRFSKNVGFYKRNMPGVEFFVNNQWIEYNKENQHLISEN